MYEGMKCLLW